MQICIHICISYLPISISVVHYCTGPVEGMQCRKGRETKELGWVPFERFRERARVFPSAQCREDGGNRAFTQPLSAASNQSLFRPSHQRLLCFAPFPLRHPVYVPCTSILSCFYPNLPIHASQPETRYVIKLPRAQPTKKDPAMFGILWSGEGHPERFLFSAPRIALSLFSACHMGN